MVNMFFKAILKFVSMTKSLFYQSIYCLKVKISGATLHSILGELVNDIPREYLEWLILREDIN